LDAVALQILHESLKQDATVIAEAAARARQWLAEGHPGSLEACGYELHRLYNVLEKAFERVCEAFENQFEKRGDYHEKLIERITLDLPGIRPPFVPPEARDALRELKSFRHVIRHAYDLRLRADRLDELSTLASQIASECPAWIDGFVERIRARLA
jgi:hypothetical protein